MPRRALQVVRHAPVILQAQLLAHDAGHHRCDAAQLRVADLLGHPNSYLHRPFVRELPAIVQALETHSLVELDRSSVQVMA